MPEIDVLPMPIGLNISRDIRFCHPYLQFKWPDLLKAFQDKTGHDLIITCTWRSVAAQQALFAQGRTVPGPIVTQIDGVERKSNHNLYPARAVDVAVDLDGDPKRLSITWADKYYDPLGEICKDLGLVWGGAWVHFQDRPHIEVPKDIA